MFQLVISDYEFVARASFIASLENRIVKGINIQALGGAIT